MPESTKLNSMLEKLQAKLSSSVGYRSDLHLADYCPINKTTAKVLLAYQKNLGPVTRDDVQNFMVKHFGAEIVPNFTTAKLHTEEGAVSLIVSTFQPTRKLEDAKAMTQIIAGVMFMDNNLNETWEVSADSEGNKFLQRAADEDINSILAERKSRMQVHASTIDFSCVTAGAATVEVGDVVKYYFGGKISQGKVSQVTDRDIMVDGNKIAKEAIVQTVSISPEKEKARQDELINYFEIAFGNKKFAQDLVLTPKAATAAADDTLKAANPYEKKEAAEKPEEEITSDQMIQRTAPVKIEKKPAVAEEEEITSDQMIQRTAPVKIEKKTAMTKKDKEKEATSDAMIQRKAPVKIEKKVAETEDEEATSDEKIEKLEARIKQLEASLSGDFNKAARAIPRLAEKLTSLKISDDMSIDTKNKFYSIAGEIEKSIEQLRGLVH